MNLSSVKTMTYEQITMNNANKNKPNTNPIKANLLDAQINVSSLLTKDYENKRLHRRGQDKPKQTQPVVSLPAVSKVEPSNLFQTRCTLCEFFLFFTFLCPSYNLAMQTWTIQKLLNWVTEHFTKKGIDSLRQAGENDGGRRARLRVSYAAAGPIREGRQCL